VDTCIKKNSTINIDGAQPLGTLKAEILLDSDNILVAELIVDNGCNQLALADHDGKMFLLSNIFRYGKFTDIFLVAHIGIDSLNNFKAGKIGTGSLFDCATDLFTGIPFYHEEKLFIGSLIPIDRSIVSVEWMPALSLHETRLGAQ
jgi:hypothetical protein